MRNMEALKKKTIDFVDELSQSDNILFSIVDYSRPRQMELFWVNKPLEFQFLVITHDDNRDDNEVFINGPYEGSKFLDELEEVLNKPRWLQPVNQMEIDRFDPATGTSIDVSTRQDTIISLFQGIEHRLGQEVLRGGSTVVRQASWLNEGNWMFFIRGNIFELDSAEEVIDYMFGDEKIEEVDPEESEDDSGNGGEQDNEEPKAITREESNALGTYIYKPVWVGGIPDLDFEDRVLINPPLDYDTVQNSQIDGYEVIITKDGFIGVEESEDKELVLDILNTIFGTSILLDNAFEAATTDDLIEIIIGEEGDVLNRWGDPSIRRRPATPRPQLYNEGPFISQSEIERKVVDEDYISELCSVAEKIYADDQMKERVNSALQAYTHHVNGEYTQAFLLAWISIEQYINSRLDEFLKESKDVNSERRRNMQRGGHWSASHLIELMEVSGCISKSRYEVITDMRKRRNDIVHDMESAGKDESKAIVNLSVSLIDEQISNGDEEIEFVIE